MKTIISLALICLISLSACSHNQHTNASSVSEKAGANTQDINKQFDLYKDNFLDEYWVYSPNSAVYNGVYKYDTVLQIPNDNTRDQKRAFLNAKLTELSAWDLSSLNVSNATDYALIKNRLEAELWYLDDYKVHEWDPSLYNVADVFGLILNTHYKSLDERLRAVSTRLEKVPAYYQAAMQTVKSPTAELTSFAINQNKGALGVFNRDIPDQIEKSGLSETERDSLDKKLALAGDAIKGYIAWLEKIDQSFDNGAKARSFRIGKELYEKKFAYDIVSDHSAAELYQRALVAKDKLHAQMIKVTTALWPKYFKDQPMPQDSIVAIKQMIDRLSHKHVGRDEFVDEIRRQMPIIQAYMDDNQLLDSDPTRPLVVRETPEYQRGFAGASIESPGPYDVTANTYYNVTPLDAFNDEQAESYLREYNHWTLQVLNIHEAIPGHYTQLVHSNKSPSKIKSIFQNGAMIEGWAVYSERMMLEEGYGNNEPEMWLMYSKWNLRVVCNTILDYSLHVLGMERDEAMNLLLNDAFQERAEAEGKWHRATVSQVQLTSYFNGYDEIYAFREELKEKMGESFDLRTFHNKFLSYGSAPVPLIRKLMLQDLGLN